MILQLAPKDIAYICFVIIALLGLLWLYVSDRYFPKLKKATRIILVASVYLSALVMQLLLGH